MRQIAIAAYVAVMLGLLALTVAVAATVGALQGLICVIFTIFAACISYDTLAD